MRAIRRKWGWLGCQCRPVRVRIYIQKVIYLACTWQNWTHCAGGYTRIVSIFIIIIIITTIMISDYYYWPVLVFIIYVYLFFFLKTVSFLLFNFPVPHPMINQKWTSHISHAADDLRATVQGTTSAAAVIVMDTDAARRITAPPAAPKKRPNWRVYFSKLGTRA